MIRIPLRPLARILPARDRGQDTTAIEREHLALRHQQVQDRARRRGERRLLFMATLFFAGFALIGVRMAVMAASPPPEVTPWRGEQIDAFRADITDRAGRILATNLRTNALYAELRHMVDGERAAHELARIFPDLDADGLARRLTDPSTRFLWIRPRLSPEQVQAVHDIGEPGLLFGPRAMRLYPNGRLAAHILGGAGFGTQGVSAAEIVGTAGIEHRLNAELRDPAREGRPLALSLDLSVQAVVEEVLSGGMTMLNARAAAAVVMDAHSGEIVAMASMPDFDPNSRPALPAGTDPTYSPLFNHAVQGSYELGSVMKAFTVAQALERGLVGPQTMIDTRGPLRVSRFSITDYRSRGPRQSVADVFIYSSNIGTARLAQMIGAEEQRAFLQSFGLLEPSPVELAEARRVRPQFSERWTELSAMTISYGHGLTTSPVMLASAYAALVNGGTRVEPTLLRRPDPVPGERLISEQTSATMRALMRAVVAGGTASLAEVPGVLPGGKTGTADKPNPAGGYYSGRVRATFAGAFPMNDPRYVIVVMLDEPEDTTGPEPRRTAGWTAAPVTGEIVRRIAPLLGVRPQDGLDIEAALLTR